MEEDGYSFRNDIIDEEYRGVREIKIRNVGNFPTCNPIGCLPNVWIFLRSNLFDSGCRKSKEQIYVYTYRRRKFPVHRIRDAGSQNERVIYTESRPVTSLFILTDTDFTVDREMAFKANVERNAICPLISMSEEVSGTLTYSSEYLAAACVYVGRWIETWMVEIGPILAQVPVTTIPARSIRLSRSERSPSSFLPNLRDFYTHI